MQVMRNMLISATFSGDLGYLRVLTYSLSVRTYVKRDGCEFGKAYQNRINYHGNITMRVQECAC